MSETMVVPAAVPFDFHSSRPCVLSTVEKSSMPFTLVRSAGPDPTPPCQMSLTRAVPVAEPLLFHSSAPDEPSSAWNRTIPLTATRSLGLDPVLPGLMSRTREGAAALAGGVGASNEPTSPSATATTRAHRVTILRLYRRLVAGARGCPGAAGRGHRSAQHAGPFTCPACAGQYSFGVRRRQRLPCLVTPAHCAVPSITAGSRVTCSPYFVFSLRKPFTLPRR